AEAPGVLTTAVPAAQPSAPRQSVAWGRVAVGVLLAAGGTVWANVIRDFVLGASGNSGDKLQSQFVTWEVSVLAMLVGGAVAGANTRRGAFHGFLVGTPAMCLLCAFQFFVEDGQRLP